MVVALAVLVITQATPTPPVTARYSGIYDSEYRSVLPNCPSMDQVAARVEHAQTLWAERGPGVLDRIRSVTSTPHFPAEAIVIYLIGCGRSISDPLTVSVYNNGPNGPFIPKTDEEILQEITHELLHHVATSNGYDTLWQRVEQWKPDEPQLVKNHILVAAFETRIYGQAYMERVYADAPPYARALKLAMDFGIGSKEPLP